MSWMEGDAPLRPAPRRPQRRSGPQPATITRPGIPGRSEPYARLDDGRVMPMGWNRGDTFTAGQTGTAEYVTSSNAGLWRFQLDGTP